MSKHLHQEKRSYNGWVIVLIIFCLIFISVFLMNVIKTPYTDTEKYTEKEPYESQETYIESEPYENCQMRDYEYGFWFEVREGFESTATLGQKITTAIQLNNKFRYSDIRYYDYFVKNLEDKKGNFGVKLDWYLKEGDTYRVVTRDGDNLGIILPKETKKESVGIYPSLMELYKENALYIQFTVNPPKLEECKNSFRETEKLRTVTKYREIEKTRTVTKYETLWKALIGKNH